MTVLKPRSYLLRHALSLYIKCHSLVKHQDSWNRTLPLCRREKQPSKDSRLLSPWEAGRVSSILAMHLTERLTKPLHFWEPEDPAVAHLWPQAPPLAMLQMAGPCFWTGGLRHSAPVNFNGRSTSNFPCTCGVATSYICGLVWAPVSSVKRWSDFVWKRQNPSLCTVCFWHLSLKHM